MKILFDHQTFSLQEYGGISRYHTELKRGLNSEYGHNVKISVLLSNNIHLRESGMNFFNFFPNKVFKGKGSFIYNVNQVYSKYMIRNVEFDIFHPTYYDTYFFEFLKKPLVVTFHDMIYEKFHDQYRELSIDKKIIDRKRMIANRADKIIAVSENTKNDIIDILKINPNKIEVIYHGQSMPKYYNIVTKYNQPFLLFVGNRSMYKNFIFFLKSVSWMLKKNNIKLVCGGGGAFSNEERSVINDLKVSHLVENVPVSDSILRQMYSEATAFVFPSKYEGFGIPILEAFSCGCPCILSNKSCLPEIGGDAAIYFDPYSADSIAHAVEKVINSDDIRRRLVKAGYDRLNFFSWNNTVKQTSNLYRNLV